MSGATSVRPGKHRKEREPTVAVGRVLAAATTMVATAVAGYSVMAPDGGTADPGLSSASKDTAAATFTGIARAGVDASLASATTEIGETRAGDNSSTTLLQVRKVPAPVGRTAGSEREWYGIRARTCMRSTVARSGRMGWSSWAVMTESGRSYSGRKAAWDDLPPQQYVSDGLDAGECQVGWVLISVPKGTYQRVVEVAYRPGDPDGASWLV